MLKLTRIAASRVLALSQRRFHVVSIMVCALLVVPLGSRAQRHDPNVRHQVTLEGDEPQLGPSDALVTVVEFGGFQDPFSARVAPTLKQLAKRYPKEVRIVWLNNPLPFHRDGLVAANAALEAQDQKGNAGFWAMHGKLLANQGALDRASLETYAKDLGLDLAKFNEALDSSRHASTIQRQQALARTVGAQGTPNFFLNGRNNVRGAVPLAAFIDAVEEELGHARQLVANGTPRNAVYAAALASKAPIAAPAASRPWASESVGDNPPQDGTTDATDPPSAREESAGGSTIASATTTAATDDGRYDRRKASTRVKGMDLTFFGVTLYEPLNLPECQIEGTPERALATLVGLGVGADETCFHPRKPLEKRDGLLGFLNEVLEAAQEPLGPLGTVPVTIAESECPAWVRLSGTCMVAARVLNGYVVGVSIAVAALNEPVVSKFLSKKLKQRPTALGPVVQCLGEWNDIIYDFRNAEWRKDGLVVSYIPILPNTFDCTMPSRGVFHVTTPEYRRAKKAQQH